MIIGIGTDLVNIARITKILKRHGSRFEQRCFTDAEQERAAGNSAQADAIYAKRFAAKEACVKALGSGIVGDIILKDIGVISDENGKPALVLTGGALKRLHAITPKTMCPVLHLSLTDDPPYALAFVIIEAHPS